MSLASDGKEGSGRLWWQVSQKPLILGSKPWKATMRVGILGPWKLLRENIPLGNAQSRNFSGFS